MEVVYRILLEIGLVSGGIGLIFWKFSSYFGKLWADKHIESIKKEHQKEIATFKAELEKRAIEHQIKFSKLHETVAEVIANLHVRITRANLNVGRYIKPVVLPGEPSKEEREKEIKMYYQLKNFFDEKEIYLEPDICKKLNIFINKIYKIMNDFKNRKDMNWGNIGNEFLNDVQEIRKDLKNEFRKVIGVK